MELKTSLLPYQVAAVEKLRRLKVGALYMEQGTGKTRTALELVKIRLDAGKIDRILWLCPCSVKGNLLADICKHSDLAESDALKICGIETLSSSVKTCSELFQTVSASRAFLIVDESSLVKNPNALRSKHITQIAGKCKYKLILNGTPITKCEADLFSQWYILDWRILGYRSFYSFAANHLEYDKDRPNRIVRAHNVDYLTRKMEPYTYQCRKEDVLDLPPKVTDTVDFSMTYEQQENYDYVIDTLLTDLDSMGDAAIYQLFGALQSVTSRFHVTVTQDKKGRNHVKREPMFQNPRDNPRTKALLSEIGMIEAFDENEKVLIFCTYTDEINGVCQALNSVYPDSAVPFNGEVSQKNRQKQLDAFRWSKRFLVANKTCGAFGLNLQFCHNIIFYSHDWNWGTRAQAEDRVHRIGQTESVNIVDLECRGSIDTQILRCLSRKERLADSFKGEMNRQSRIAFLKGVKTDGENLSPAKCVRGNAGTS